MLEAIAPTQMDTNISLEKYPQSWYPICLSKTLKHGKVLVQQAFGLDWILFRDKDKIGMMRRHCAHMGTDLALGKIVNGQIECPLHRWRYDTEGNCELFTRAEAVIPITLLTIEKYGIIFAFWGAKPLFPLPVFDLCNPIMSDPTQFKVDTALVVIGMNTFDLVHYMPVHHRKLEGIPKLYSHHPFHLGLIYEASIKVKVAYDKLIAWIGRNQRTNQIDCVGGNIFLITSHSTNFYSIIYAMPVSSYKSKFYLLTACNPNKSVWKSFLFDKFKCYLGRIITGKFLEQDIKVAKNMRPRFDHPSLKEDLYLSRFFQFWHHLPKI